MIKEIIYLAPGDTIKSKTENRHFHRDMTYTVSHCFQTPDGNAVYVKDKYGFDVPLQTIEYELTAKTYTIIEKRKKEALIQYLWNFGTTGEIFNGWDRSNPDKVRKDSIYYEIFGCGLETVGFGSYPNAISQITKYEEDHDGKQYNEVKKYIYSYDEFLKYFMDEIPETKWQWNSFGIKGMETKIQNINVFMYYMMLQSYPNDMSVLNKPAILFNRWESRNFKNVSWQEFKEYCADLIFDKQRLNNDELNLIKDIMILYRDLPSSHSATSVSKYIIGKSKIKINKVEHLFGKYPTILKQPQMYELASLVESYLYAKGIFATKEEYGSDTKWRGTFEFIGSKYINNDELNKIINE